MPGKAYNESNGTLRPKVAYENQKWPKCRAILASAELLAFWLFQAYVYGMDVVTVSYRAVKGNPPLMAVRRVMANAY